MTVQLYRVIAACAALAALPLSGCATPPAPASGAALQAPAATSSAPAGPVWFFPEIDWQAITDGGRGG